MKLKRPAYPPPPQKQLVHELRDANGAPPRYVGRYTKLPGGQRLADARAVNGRPFPLNFVSEMQGFLRGYVRVINTIDDLPGAPGGPKPAQDGTD